MDQQKFHRGHTYSHSPKPPHSESRPRSVTVPNDSSAASYHPSTSQIHSAECSPRMHPKQPPSATGDLRDAPLWRYPGMSGGHSECSPTAPTKTPPVPVVPPELPPRPPSMMNHNKPVPIYEAPPELPPRISNASVPPEVQSRSRPDLPSRETPPKEPPDNSCSVTSSEPSPKWRKKAFRKKGESKRKKQAATAHVPQDSFSNKSAPKSLTLGEFMQHYSDSLPLRVRVSRGFYGDTSQETISATDMFNIHFEKQTTVILMEDGSHQFYSIPLGSASMFSLLYNPNKSNDEAMNGHKFPTVTDIIAAEPLPKVVCATKSFSGKDESCSVKANEILVLQSITRATGSRKGKRGLMAYSVQTKSTKQLPGNCAGHFSTQSSLTKMHIPEIITNIPNPFPFEAVMYLDSGVDSQSFPLSQVITLHETRTEMSLVASEAREDEDKGKSPNLIEIPLDGSLSSVAEIIVVEEESEDLYGMTMSLFKEFDPTKLKHSFSSKSSEMQTLLYTALRKGHENVGVHLHAPKQRSRGPVSAEQVQAENEEDQKHGYDIISFTPQQVNSSHLNGRPEELYEEPPQPTEEDIRFDKAAVPVTSTHNPNTPPEEGYEIPVEKHPEPKWKHAIDKSETTSSNSENDDADYNGICRSSPAEYMHLEPQLTQSIPDSYEHIHNSPSQPVQSVPLSYEYIDNSPSSPAQSNPASYEYVDGTPSQSGQSTSESTVLQMLQQLSRRMDSMEAQRNSSLEQLTKQVVESVGSQLQHITLPHQLNPSQALNKSKHESESTDSGEVVDTSTQHFDPVPSSLVASMEATEGIKMKYLQQELCELAGWYRLGINLDVPVGILEQIHASHAHGPDGEEKCKLRMLSYWQDNADNPTWSTLTEALYKIGKKNLAKDIARKYNVPLPNPSYVQHLQTPLNQKGSSLTFQESARLTALCKEMEIKEEELHGVDQRQAQLTKNLSLLQTDLTRVTESLQFSEQLTRDILTETQMLKMELADKKKEVQRLKSQSKKYKKCLQVSNSPMQCQVTAGIETAIRESKKIQKERESEASQLQAELDESESKHKSALREGNKLRKHLQEIDGKLTIVTDKLLHLQTQKEDLKTALQKCEKDSDELLLSKRSTAATAAVNRVSTKEYYRTMRSEAKVGLKLRESEAETLQRKLKEKDGMIVLLTEQLQDCKLRLKEVDESIYKQEQAALSPYSEPGALAEPEAIEMEKHQNQHLKSMLHAECLKLRAEVAQVMQGKYTLETKARHLQTKIEHLQHMQIEIEDNLAYYSSMMRKLPSDSPRTSSVRSRPTLSPSLMNSGRRRAISDATPAAMKCSNLHGKYPEKNQVTKEPQKEEFHNGTKSKVTKSSRKPTDHAFTPPAAQATRTSTNTPPTFYENIHVKYFQEPPVHPTSNVPKHRTPVSDAHAYSESSRIHSTGDSYEYETMSVTDSDECDGDTGYVLPEDLTVSSSEESSDDEAFTPEQYLIPINGHTRKPQPNPSFQPGRPHV